MSSVETVAANNGHRYDYYTPAFYAAWGHSPLVMDNAKSTNDLISAYLYAFDARDISQLDPELQNYLHDQARLVFSQEAFHD
jgi:hypothetical protein